jgi:hypothetical protein
MKKLLLILLVGASLPAFAQHNRRVLMEEFTNASCGPCAAQNPAFHALTSANEEFITPIKYQTNWPGFDPMNVHTQAQVQPRVDYYGINGVPDGFANGNLPMTNYDGGQGLNFFTQQKIMDAYNTLTPVSIAVSHELTADYDSVLIEVSVTLDSATASLAGDLRLRVAVTEAQISFSSAPGTNGETEFYNVMRRMLPNPTGTSTGEFVAGETKTYNMAWALQNIYNLNKIEVIAWLQDDATKEVFQSERSLPLNNVAEIGMAFPFSSEPLKICTNSYTPVFEFTNTDTSELTTAELRYRVDNLPWETFTWTGSVAPGETGTLTLPEVVLPAGVTHSFTLEPISSNNGIQVNMVNPGITSNILTFTATVAAPASEDFQTASSMPPAGWGVVNVDATNGWKLKIGAGAGSTRSAWINFYDFPEGSVDLYSPRLDLTTMTDAQLTFDHAYRYYSSGGQVFTDEFQIAVSTDCGETWTDIFAKAGDDLATTTPIASAYTSPLASHWDNNVIDFSDYDGVSDVLLRFRGISGYGNNFFIDNIAVSQLVDSKEPLELTAFSVTPNPAYSSAEVTFSLENGEAIQLAVYNNLGVRVQNQELGNLPAGAHTARIDAAALPAGSYRVVLQGAEKLAQKQLVVVK